MTNPIKVFIVDDHLIVREGITSILDIVNDIEVVGQAGNAEEALSLIGQLGPDVILVDLRMPGTDGIQLTRLIKEKFITCKVIVLTLYDQYVSEAIRAGAKGYLLKDITLEDLVDSIKRVNAGEEVYDTKAVPTIKVEYEGNSGDEQSISNDSVGQEAPGDTAAIYNQARIFILPPADISESLKITSILEEAVSGDFKQVEGTTPTGISITFNLNNILSLKDLNERLTKVSYIKIISPIELAGRNDPQNLIEKQHAFDLKHPMVKTIFIELHLPD
ncbi:response regulator transcription factor [Chloroflexota bacterium]